MRRVRAGGGSLSFGGGSVESGRGAVRLDVARLDVARLGAADGASSGFASGACEGGAAARDPEVGARRLVAIVRLVAAVPSDIAALLSAALLSGIVALLRGVAALLRGVAALLSGIAALLRAALLSGVVALLRGVVVLVERPGSVGPRTRTALPDVVERLAPRGVAVPRSEPVPPGSSSGSIGSSSTARSSGEQQIQLFFRRLEARRLAAREHTLLGGVEEQRELGAELRRSRARGGAALVEHRRDVEGIGGARHPREREGRVARGSCGGVLSPGCGSDGGGSVPNASSSIPICAMRATASITASTSTGLAWARPEARVALSSAARTGSPRKNSSGCAPVESSRSRSTASIAPG